MSEVPLYAPWLMGVKWCVVLVEVWPGMAPMVAESVFGLGVEHTAGQPAERANGETLYEVMRLCGTCSMAFPPTALASSSETREEGNIMR